jgi:hypothetical protein
MNLNVEHKVGTGASPCFINRSSRCVCFVSVISAPRSISPQAWTSLKNRTDHVHFSSPCCVYKFSLFRLPSSPLQSPHILHTLIAVLLTSLLSLKITFSHRVQPCEIVFTLPIECGSFTTYSLYSL